MGYVRITDRPEELFHYTRRDNLASILRDGRIKRMGIRIRHTAIRVRIVVPAIDHTDYREAPPGTKLLI